MPIELPEPAALDNETESPISEYSFPDWFNRMLVEHGMSLASLSEKTGISYMGLWNIKNGNTSNPQQKTRSRIEQAFGENFRETDADMDGKAIRTTSSGGALIGDLRDFDPHSDDVPNCCGVYVFYDISNRPIYVGKVSSGGRTIRARVREHEDKFWFKRPIVNHASYVEINDPALCAAVEKILIKFLKTNAVLNKDYVKREK